MDRVPVSKKAGMLPLLKWTGGKRALSEKIISYFPAYTGRYYEPFFGGGAIFFRHNPSKSVLADVNSEIMNCYVQVRDRPNIVADALAGWENSESSYYQVRSERHSCAAKEAARTIFLTSLSFNGIYRQNLKGEFNVPYGYKAKQVIPDHARLVEVSKTLQSSDILAADFAESTADARSGDLVYFDPPYTVAHSNNGFVKYNAKIFSWQDQARLAQHACLLANRGCHVVISNADHPSIDELYKSFQVARLARPSVMAAKSEFRRPVKEALFYL